MGKLKIDKTVIDKILKMALAKAVFLEIIASIQHTWCIYIWCNFYRRFQF